MCGFRCHCETLRFCFSSAASTSVTRQYGLGGTGSALCSLVKSDRNASPPPQIFHPDDGTWMRCSSKSTVKPTTFGALAITKLRFWNPMYRTPGISEKRWLSLKKLMKRYGNPSVIISSKIKFYCAAMKDLCNERKQVTGRYVNNLIENSHLPIRRRERSICCFHREKTLQKFSAVFSALQIHFNGERHLNYRDIFKEHRNAALAEWRQLDPPKFRCLPHN